ncbi:DUF4274 domain-containing protein [Bradyrhizobium sp. LjRoot220]|uniref:hypothetical protein n=1 Tax=Bradyrhizobium sp. LjRoot220 TaxID=3342284 RepID=UPI003ED06EB9
MAEASTIPVIYETNRDGSQSDWRDYRAEIEAWLPSQPQGTWLMFLKNSIWDGGESLRQRMIDDPDCDIAIAAWIFWACQPGWHIANETEFKGDEYLIRSIAANIDRGFYRRSELALNRFEVLHSVHDYADAVRTRRLAGRPAWMTLPRSLLGPFIGRQPAVAPGNEATERHLDEIAQRLGFPGLIRTQAAWRDAYEGNYCIRHYFTLPPLTRSLQRDLGTLDELAHIEALYGNTAAYTDARKLLAADMPYLGKQTPTSLIGQLRWATRGQRGNRQYYERV